MDLGLNQVVCMGMCFCASDVILVGVSRFTNCRGEHPSPPWQAMKQLCERPLGTKWIGTCEMEIVSLRDCYVAGWFIVGSYLFPHFWEHLVYPHTKVD